MDNGSTRQEQWRVCQQCGIQFQRRGIHGPEPKYCSANCRARAAERAHYAERQAAKFERKAAKMVDRELARIRHCAQCEREIRLTAPQWQAMHRGQDHFFCSRSCAAKFGGQQRFGTGKKYINRICQHCGKEYLTKVSDRDQYCSRECHYAHVAARCKKCGAARPPMAVGWRDYCPACREANHTRKCIVCGATFTSNNQAKACSDACRVKYAKSKWAQYGLAKKDFSERACKTCGARFTPAYGDKRKTFCSLTCSRKWAKQSENARASHREQNRKRKARQIGAYIAPVFFSEVCERDKWRCGICGKPVNPKLRYPNPMSKSLDHILPLAKGGTHEPANAQLAHWICNTEKGANFEGQLRLIG